jgi:hypothetical protein
MLKTGEMYRQLGEDYFSQRDPEKTTKRLVRQLEALGHVVTLQTPPPTTSAEDPELAA